MSINDDQKTEPRLRIKDYNKKNPRKDIGDYQKTEPRIEINDYQRTEPRYIISLNVTIKGIDRDFKCETRDLSINGLFIKTAHKFKENDYLDLSIEIIPMNAEIEVLGKIVHSIPGYGIGLQFIDYFDNAKKMLETLIEYTRNQNKQNDN